MVKLTKDQAAVNEVRAIVLDEEEKMRNETDLVTRYAQEAEKDLADVIPLLASARESLNALNKADISEIRQLIIFCLFYLFRDKNLKE